MPGELIPIVLFIVMGAVGISFSPIGRAMARRAGGAKDDPDIEELKAEIAELRERLADAEARLGGELDELHNRVDFAERVIAQQQAKGALPGER